MTAGDECVKMVFEIKKVIEIAATYVISYA